MEEVAAIANRSNPQNERHHRIALRFDNTTNNIPTDEQLRDIRSIGIDLLEVSLPGNISTAALDSFYLMLNSPLRFTLEYHVREQQNYILDSYLANYQNVPNLLKDNIAAVKVFEFPADYNPAFRSSADSVIMQLSGLVDEPLYYQSAYANPKYPIHQMDFIVHKVNAWADSIPDVNSSAVYFDPGTDAESSLQTLQVVLNRSLDRPESIVIIPANWFLERLELQPSFASIISSYLEGETITFPMPAPSRQYPEPNWPIIILLFIWAGFVLHYKYQPVYRTALPRYFFNHTFFIHDVFQLRIRNASPGIIILLQYAFLTGFFCYLLANNFISKAGLNSLSHHFPAIIYPGFEKLSLFIIGILCTLFILIISIMWLYLPNKKLKQINQVINLYSWPLQCNLVVVTLMVYSMQIYPAKNWTLAAVVIYAIVWFSSFIIAAIDGAKVLEKFQAVYLFLTIGLYLIFTITVIGIVLWLPALSQPLSMAVMLP